MKLRIPLKARRLVNKQLNKEVSEVRDYFVELREYEAKEALACRYGYFLAKDGLHAIRRFAKEELGLSGEGLKRFVADNDPTKSKAKPKKIRTAKAIWAARRENFEMIKRVKERVDRKRASFQGDLQKIWEFEHPKYLKEYKEKTLLPTALVPRPVSTPTILAPNVPPPKKEEGLREHLLHHLKLEHIKDKEDDYNE